MQSNNPSNEPNYQSTAKGKTKRRWLWALVVFVVLVLLYSGGVLWTAGPGKTRALQPVNQAVSDVNPGQFGTILYEDSIGPNSDQAPERDFIIEVNGSPTDTLSKVAGAFQNMGFSGSTDNAFGKPGGSWKRTKNGKFIDVEVGILEPGDNYDNTNDPSATVPAGKTGLTMNFTGEN